MELITLHRRAVEQWAARVAAVKNDQWVDPTPCTEWSVRELVNHVVAEELWTAPLLRGSTVQGVGSQFDGDVWAGTHSRGPGRVRTRPWPSSTLLSRTADGFSCRTAKRTWRSTSANCAPTT